MIMDPFIRGGDSGSPVCSLASGKGTRFILVMVAIVDMIRIFG